MDCYKADTPGFGGYNFSIIMLNTFYLVVIRLFESTLAKHLHLMI